MVTLTTDREPTAVTPVNGPVEALGTKRNYEAVQTLPQGGPLPRA